MLEIPNQLKKQDIKINTLEKKGKTKKKIKKRVYI